MAKGKRLSRQHRQKISRALKGRGRGGKQKPTLEGHVTKGTKWGGIIGGGTNAALGALYGGMLGGPVGAAIGGLGSGALGTVSGGISGAGIGAGVYGARRLAAGRGRYRPGRYSSGAQVATFAMRRERRGKKPGLAGRLMGTTTAGRLTRLAGVGGAIAGGMALRKNAAGAAAKAAVKPGATAAAGMVAASTPAPAAPRQPTKRELNTARIAQKRTALGVGSNRQTNQQNRFDTVQRAGGAKNQNLGARKKANSLRLKQRQQALGVSSNISANRQNRNSLINRMGGQKNLSLRQRKMAKSRQLESRRTFDITLSGDKKANRAKKNTIIATSGGRKNVSQGRLDRLNQLELQSRRQAKKAGRKNQLTPGGAARLNAQNQLRASQGGKKAENWRRTRRRQAMLGKESGKLRKSYQESRDAKAYSRNRRRKSRGEGGLDAGTGKMSNRDVNTQTGRVLRTAYDDKQKKKKSFERRLARLRQSANYSNPSSIAFLGHFHDSAEFARKRRRKDKPKTLASHVGRGAKWGAFEGGRVGALHGAAGGAVIGAMTRGSSGIIPGALGGAATLGGLGATTFGLAGAGLGAATYGAKKLAKRRKRRR